MHNIKKQLHTAKKIGMTPMELAQIREAAKRYADQAVAEQMVIANEKAFLQILAMPCMILCEDYWKKTAKQRVPKFIEDVMSLWESYKLGIVTDEDLAEAVYKYAGVTIEAEWIKAKERKQEDGKE